MNKLRLRWYLLNMYMTTLSFIYAIGIRNRFISRYLYYNFTSYWMDESLVGNTFRAKLYNKSFDLIDNIMRWKKCKYGIKCYDEVHNEGAFSCYAE